MNIYIPMILLSTFFAMIATAKRGKKELNSETDTYSTKENAIWIILSALPPYLVSALRYGLGTDYFFTYVPRFYRYMSDPNLPLDWEPAFWLLYKGLVKVTTNPQWVFVVTSAVIIGLVWYSVFKVSSLPWMGILLFFISRQFFISLNGVRQYVGLAFVLLGITFLKEKKYLGYLVCVFLGTLCHYSTAIFFVAFGLAFVVISPLEGILIVGVMSVFAEYFKGLLRAIISKTVYASYIGGTFDTNERYNPWTIFELLFVFCVLVILMQKYPKKDKNPFMKYLFDTNLLCLFVSFNLNLLPNSERISWSLELPSILLIPEVINRVDNKKEKTIVTTCVTLVYAYVMYMRLLEGDHEVVPYQVIPTLSVLLYT